MKRLIPLLLSFTVLLTACGSTGSVDGNVVVDGKTVMVEEITTDTAKEDKAVIGGIPCKVKYKKCDSLNCGLNTLGVLEENMTRIGSKGYAYVMYQSTQVVYHIERKQGVEYCEAFVETEDQNGFEGIGVQAVCSYLDERMKSLTFGEIKSITFNNKVDVNVTSYDFAIRPTQVVIPGVLRVELGTKDGISTPIKLGKVDAMMSSTLSGKFDYYQVEDILITVAKGLDIRSIFTVKG